MFQIIVFKQIILTRTIYELMNKNYETIYNYKFLNYLYFSFSFPFDIFFRSIKSVYGGKTDKSEKHIKNTTKSFRNLLPCLTLQLPHVGLQTECLQVLDKPPRLTIALPKLWTRPNPTWPDHCLHPRHKYQDQVRVKNNSKIKNILENNFNFQCPPTLAEMLPETS